jgi:hypothetical protein
MTAQEKFFILKNWRKFINGGFQRRHFTKRLYDHLHLHCGFISHYDINGFYRTFFGNKPFLNPELKTFLGHFDPGHKYNFTWCFTGDFADLNNAMSKELEPHLPDIYKRIDTMVNNDEVALAFALLSKHGYDVESVKKKV